MYYRKADQWAMIHPMPASLMGMSATTLEGRVWIFGGLGRSKQGSTLQDSVYVFNPRTDS